MATDYFGVLGLAREASDADIKRAYRRLARDLHPDVNPDPEAKERFQEVTRAYEALTDPEKRRIVDLGGDPFDTGGGAGGNGFGGAGLRRPGRHHGRLLRRRDHPRPPQPHPGRPRRAHPDRARARRGGVRHRQGAHRRHRRPLRRLHGRRYRPRHARHHLHDLLRAGRGAERAAQLPRPGGVQPRLPDLLGHRDGHPRAVPQVRRRRPRPRPPEHLGEGARRRRGRHADPAHRPGRGRPRRWPGRRPLRRGARAPARRLHPGRRGPALPGHAADDLRGAGHHAQPQDPGRRGGPRHRARHPVGQRPDAAGARRPAAAGHRPRQPGRARRRRRPRPGSTASRRSCCASWPPCAARTSRSPTARRRAGCSPGCATPSTGADR